MEYAPWIAYMIASFWVGYFIRKTIKKAAWLMSGSYSDG